MNKRPIAVCISDIHFNINTLEIASKSLISALHKAEELDTTLIIAGDLHDTKDIIRGKVANTIISILKQARTPVKILVGNHDLLNEKGDENGLNYLAPYAQIIDKHTKLGLYPHLHFIPYQNSTEKFKYIISTINQGALVVMHQGVKGAFMGDYIQDKTSIDSEDLKDFTVISGHYHRHQTIGTVTYIGSPYSISFGEAKDTDKGFLILNNDGSFERHILNFRRHKIIELHTKDLLSGINGEVPHNTKVNKDDLLWVKIYGPRSELDKVNKKDIGIKLLGHSNYKLDKIIMESIITGVKEKNMSDGDILDFIIDRLPEIGTQKDFLKKLWREIIKEI